MRKKGWRTGRRYQQNLILKKKKAPLKHVMYMSDIAEGKMTWDPLRICWKFCFKGASIWVSCDYMNVNGKYNVWVVST